MAEMYREKSPSLLPKSGLAVAHGAAVAVAAWLLFGGGIDAIWAGSEPGPPLRRGLLLGAAVVYFLRTLVTTFVFAKRRVTWAEAGVVAAWIELIQLLCAYFGGRQTDPVGFAEWAGVALYLAGSYLNTGSEYQRHVWKQRPEHQGKLYTAGLFRFARHINYFGDLVLFSGWVLVTGQPALFVLPALMLGGFVFAGVPSLDRYLTGRYGEAFREYAARTPKLVPFVY